MANFVFILLSFLTWISDPTWATNPIQVLDSNSAFEAETTIEGHFKLKLKTTIPQIENFEIIRGFSKRFLSAPESLNYATSRWEVSEQELQEGWTDAHKADGVNYIYLIRALGAKKTRLATYQIKIAQRTLPELKEPLIVIDKLLHTLEVYDQGELVKIYPAAFGSDPMNRKLFQDNKTTPEGIYQIIGRQHQAKFYKAYDLNYPNAEDKKRWQQARSSGEIPLDAAIGGEIQIHGKDEIIITNEIELNWTYGCIALRNSDLDELFSELNVNTKTRVIILGTDFTRDDLSKMAQFH